MPVIGQHRIVDETRSRRLSQSVRRLTQAIAGSGLDDTGSALEIALATVSGLEFDENDDLRIDVHQGVEIDANGLSAKAGTGIVVDGDGINVDDTVFVPYTGATANVDLGAFDLDATDITGDNSVSVGGTLLLTSGSITDSGGTIDFGDETLSTSGSVTAGSVTATTTIQGEQVTSTDDITMLGHLLTLGNNSATDIVISFDGSANDGTLTYDESANEFSFSSTFNAPILNVGRIVVDNLTLDGAAITSDTGTVSFADDLLESTAGFSCGSTRYGDNVITDVGVLELSVSDVQMTDNVELRFGASQDWNIHFNGTDLEIVDNTGGAGSGIQGSFANCEVFAVGHGTQALLITQQTTGTTANRPLQLSLDFENSTNTVSGVSDCAFFNVRIGPTTTPSGTIALINNMDVLISALGGTSPITEWNGVSVRENWNTNYNGTISSLSAFHVQDWTDTSITVTAAYGLKIEDITVGTSSYAIHTGKGDISLGDSTISFGVFGATPVAQQTTSSQTPASFTANTSGISDDTATWGGYTVGDIVAILQAYGFLA